MSGYNVISADSHIVEPPDLYESRIEPKFRNPRPASNGIAPGRDRSTTPGTSRACGSGPSAP